MDKREHGRRLKAAMAARNVGRAAVATATGNRVRTVTNWTSGSTMPRDEDLVVLRRLFPGYDDDGDAVERAVRGSELQEWRQSDVIATYQRHVHEQRREQAG